ncbi:uncharacterized protein LOC110706525 [Chenopodium quinoa]|uniref:uncharacterized protein LOC110706525 n=1 Tax=Chenopodium quinoa TaxID=63459 RepID=UPI000B78EA30|nr:uncharacterized protein LOC110706525 [Chenopodium quinoa]
MSPPVVTLQIHLPNQHSVRFSPNEQLASVVSDRRRARTSLTEFFRMNNTVPNIPKYTYAEFCEHYVWNHGTKTWSKRANVRTAVGRLTFVAPSKGERYFLRLLLINVRGPKSFEDLRTVNGHLCATFQEAALKLGLLAEDDAIDKCMAEAVTAHMATALRKLFATILIFGMPRDPLALWQKYYIHLSEDIRHQNPGMEDKVKALTVQGVERFLEEMGKTLEEFGLGVLISNADSGLRQTKDIADALNATIPVEYIEAIDKLNLAQRDAFDCIIKHVQLNKPGSFFVDGPGGTGKTYLYCALYAAVRKMGKIVLPTATSGIAASNIVTGRTAHSRFKIPLDHTASMSCNVSKQSSLAGLLRESSLITWDEASMAIKENVESLDLLLRDLCDSRTAFGGKVVVFGGDFRQVLPVVPKKSQKEVVQASLVSSYLWHGFKRIRLSQNMRARTDPAFSDFLLALGDGRMQTEEIAAIHLPRQLVVPFEDENYSLDQLLSQIFPELTAGSFSSSIFAERAILTPLNDDVDEINTLLIAKHPGQAVTYKSFDVLIDENCKIYTTEFLNTLCPGGMSPHELVLKENCPVILLRNLAPASGLCNGTRLICKRFYPNMIECVIATGHHTGEYVFLPRIDLRPSASTNYPFQFQQKQFPIKLCFAMTINKAQGQTLTQVGIYLRRPCFSHGQLYVALSRARNSKHVRVLTKPTTEDQHVYSAKNVISFEILLRSGVTQQSPSRSV